MPWVSEDVPSSLPSRQCPGYGQPLVRVRRMLGHAHAWHTGRGTGAKFILRLRPELRLEQYGERGREAA